MKVRQLRYFRPDYRQEEDEDYEEEDEEDIKTSKERKGKKRGDVKVRRKINDRNAGRFRYIRPGWRQKEDVDEDYECEEEEEEEKEVVVSKKRKGKKAEGKVLQKRKAEKATKNKTKVRPPPSLPRVIHSEDEEDMENDSSDMSPEKKETMRKLTASARNCAISVISYANFLQRARSFIPDIPLDQINEQNEHVRTLLQIIKNKSIDQAKPVWYYSSEIVLIKKKFYKKGKPLKRIVKQHWKKADFQLKFFSDSSISKGPCHYHELDKTRRYSALYHNVVLKKKWKAYTYNKTWKAGATYQENKEAAFSDQRKGKFAWIVRSMREQTDAVKKVEGINKAFDSKFTASPFLMADAINSIKVAMDDEIPSIINDVEKWEEYDLEAICKRIDTKGGRVEVEDGDFEFTSPEENKLIWDLDKEMIDKYKEMVMAHIFGYKKRALPMILSIDMWGIIALQQKGPMTLVKMVDWLNSNVSTEDGPLWERSRLYHQLDGRLFFKCQSSEFNRYDSKYYLVPQLTTKINEALSEWRALYSTEIKERIKTEGLWEDLNSMVLDQRTLEQAEIDVINASVAIPEPPNTTPKYNNLQMTLIMSTVLPLEYAVALLLKKRQYAMSQGEIYEYLRRNCDVCRHWQKNSRSILNLRLKNSKYFDRKGKSHSAIYILKTEDGALMKELEEELQEWITGYEKEIRDEILTEDMEDLIFGSKNVSNDD